MSNIAIIIAIVTVILTVGTQIFINTKLKFAKTEEEAMSHTKNLALNLGFVLISCIVAYRLFIELTSDAPLDRKSLASILFLSFALFNFYFSWVMLSIVWILKKMSTIQRYNFDKLCEICKKQNP